MSEFRASTAHDECRSDFHVPEPYFKANQRGTRTVGDIADGLAEVEQSPGSQPPSSRANRGFGHENTLISWYSEKDPENPQNWSIGKKLWVSSLLLVYTFAVYVGSSLYTVSEPEIVDVFGVSSTAAAVGLTVYVIGYGMGPMLFSPLSEIPAVGRNPLYIITFLLFVLLCVPLPLVDSFAGLIVLRFLLGFWGSPCLATAAASYGDIWGPVELPYWIALWGGGATLAPALGPVIGGFAVRAMGWRWSSWELLWLSAPMLLTMSVSLPETSPDTILLRRAKRLRIQTGNRTLRSESEIKQARMSPREIAFQALIKPWQINVLDPAVLFSTFYTALTYGIYYSFFESFPLVYSDIYGFDIAETGLCFLAVLVGIAIAVPLLCVYFYFIAPRQFEKMDTVPPEARLLPGLFATFAIPAGLFTFASENIHWIVSLCGVTISMVGVFIITQCMFIYLPYTYPKYSGSLFAANGFARSLLAGGAILFARPMFQGLGVSGGVSLLAGFSVLCIFGIYGIYFFGHVLRRRSRFAGT
ncbi:hypothetical protein VTK73DRAFT_4852 [Phialemonium thermophilum]|uniref:Major facilitator superfamily (MFS) profile domain-containing protein n=1 Tax=Phialemonium thermophilum TaxID=223376 RepID=A0ABR3WRD2_9PEZI